MLFKRVVIAVSGGVDSAVSALLLKRRGYEVHGVFMRNWDDINEKGFCSSDRDAEDAEWVCKHIDIKFHHVNFVKEYWNLVFNDFLQEYKDGFTPNPDILCNQRVKFDCFYKYATDILGTDAIATGHYARTSFGDYLQNYKVNEKCHLLKAVDSIKDQTFFLSQVPQFSLQMTMFPVGSLLKSDVKSISAVSGMGRLLKKKETRGICFIGKRNFQNFISEYIDPSPGNFIDIDTGKIVGTHEGIHHWTNGQRSKIPGKSHSYIIVKKSKDSNDILVASGSGHMSLYTQFVFTSQPYWIYANSDDLFENGVLECKFRFQHSKPFIDCKVVCTLQKDLIVHLSEPVYAVTPGQYAVFYTDKECLGSAKIIYVGPSFLTLQPYSYRNTEDNQTRLAVGL